MSAAQSFAASVRAALCSYKDGGALAIEALGAIERALTIYDALTGDANA